MKVPPSTGRGASQSAAEVYQLLRAQAPSAADRAEQARLTGPPPRPPFVRRLSRVLSPLKLGAPARMPLWIVSELVLFLSGARGACEALGRSVWLVNAFAASKSKSALTRGDVDELSPCEPSDAADYLIKQSHRNLLAVRSELLGRATFV